MSGRVPPGIYWEIDAHNERVDAWLARQPRPVQRRTPPKWDPPSPVPLVFSLGLVVGVVAFGLMVLWALR